jgi:transcriptional regulator with XRE-family HTH domain
VGGETAGAFPAGAAVPGCLSIIVLMRSQVGYGCANIVVMAVNNDTNPAKHFGRQMKKERTARGWTLREFSAHTGVGIGYASQIENGKRPPTERVAIACDAAFPERRGWFLEYYTELSTWSEVPPAFKDWREREDRATRLHVWSPSIVDGFLQTEGYARSLLETYPGVTPDTVSARLADRMERQRRLFGRDVRLWFIVDELALYRCAGSPDAMAGQMRHLMDVAAMPQVTLQVLPAIVHPATGSVIVIADESAYVEHAASGYVYTGESVTALERLFDTLRGECRPVSESGALLERLERSWSTGASPLTAVPTVGTA